jgi:hypothetical protein
LIGGIGQSLSIDGGPAICGTATEIPAFRPCPQGPTTGDFDMRKTFATLTALTFLAVSGGFASASDNGDGAQTLNEIRAVQQTSREGKTPQGLDRFSAMTTAHQQKAEAIPAFEYRGNAR